MTPPHRSKPVPDLNSTPSDGGRAPPSDHATRASHQAPAGLGHSAGIVGAESREIAIEAFYAVLRAAVSAAYSRQVKRGYTSAVMAARLGMSEQWVRKMLLVPRELKSLDSLSDICFAMNCEPTFHLEDGRAFIALEPWDDMPAQGIDARSGQTEGLDPKGESPVAESDAPETSSLGGSNDR